MLVQQFFVNGLAHCSYLLGGSKTCAVIDPRRDIQIYLDTAKAMGLKVTHILETHPFFIRSMSPTRGATCPH